MVSAPIVEYLNPIDFISAAVGQGRREGEDLLLVVAGQDQDGAVVVGLLDGDDLPEARRGAGGGDDEVLVEDDVV